MDFHKLQQTLNDIEPSDPAQDVRRLKQAALGNNAPEQRQTVAESTVPSQPVVHQLSESEQFAALAGIQLSERQRKGPAGQAKGSDSTPKKTTPSKRGEQKHPLKDKLVGSSTGYNEKDVDDVEEGVVDQFKQGYNNHNSLKAYKGVLGGGTSNTKEKTSKSSSSASADNSLPPKLAAALAPYATALTNVLKDPRKKQLFTRLMATADPSLAGPAPARESKQVSDRASTIKEDLLRRLNNKK